jgi:hypothetical protein
MPLPRSSSSSSRKSWRRAPGRRETATGEGNAEADVIVIHSDQILVDGGDYKLAFWTSEDAASSGELTTTIFLFLAIILL